jgi:hypothetical protein
LAFSFVLINIAAAGITDCLILSLGTDCCSWNYFHFPKGRNKPIFTALYVRCIDRPGREFYGLYNLFSYWWAWLKTAGIFVIECVIHGRSKPVSANMNDLSVDKPGKDCCGWNGWLSYR